MTLSELYLLIGLPDGVVAQLNEYEENRTCEIPPEIKVKLFCRQTWTDGVEELKAFLEDDSYVSQKRIDNDVCFGCGLASQSLPYGSWLSHRNDHSYPNDSYSLFGALPRAAIAEQK